MTVLGWGAVGGAGEGCGDVRRGCTGCVGTMSRPHTCLWYHGRGTSPEPVPALFAVAPRPSQALLQPLLLAQCGVRAPHQRCAPPKWGCSFRGAGSCSLSPAARLPSSVVQRGPRSPRLGRHPQAHPACRGTSGILAASRCHHRLPHSCARTPSPRPVCRARHPGLSHPAASAGDGRPTIAHKGRMSPQSLPPARLRGNLPREGRAPPDARRTRSFVLLTLARSDTRPRGSPGTARATPALGEQEEEEDAIEDDGTGLALGMMALQGGAQWWE